MPQQAALPVGRHEDHTAGSEVAAPPRRESLLRTEQDPLIVQRSGMLVPAPVRVVIVGVRGRAEVLIRAIGESQRYRVMRGERRRVPVQTHPTVVEGRHVVELGTRVAGRSADGHVPAEVPQNQPFLRRGIDRDVPDAGVAIDLRLIDVRDRLGLERARRGLIADDHRPTLTAHPSEEGVVLRLLQPHRLWLVQDGPAVARSLRHGPDVDAANRAAVAHVRVVRRRRVGREHKRLVMHRHEAPGEGPPIAHADARREVHDPIARAAVYEQGARFAIVRQRYLVPAFGVVMPPARAGRGEDRGRDLVHLHARRRVEVGAAGRYRRHVEGIIGRGERHLRGRCHRQKRRIWLTASGKRLAEDRPK